jgi:phosphatidylinositol-4,5-bisphosphate 3-kinase
MVVDPLYRLKSEDKVLFWTHRHQLKGLAQALPKVVQSADWLNVEQRHEVYRLLKEWKSPDLPIQAIELLDVRFHDARVRQWAVNQLRNLKDDELQLFLLQLTQALKTEPYHDSPLTRFLVHRALQNPYQVGHFFFWHLKAELANPEFCERYGVILEEFLSFAGEFTKQLRKQNNTVRKLQRLAELIVKLKLEHKYTDQQCMKEYNSEIEKLNRDFFSKMGSFQVPLNPRVEATTLIPSKCRYMSSKKIPLWLVFNNADSEGTPIYIIFKAGDDLRQDILTLQLLKIMDKIWLQDNLDMRLKPYRCLATGVNERGEGVGMIEVVLNSDTTSGIQLKYGGGAFGALKMEPIDLFLRDHNKQPDMFKAAQENFVYSCAGYCVATYVMGIGDRHNGNIMVTKDGHLFHIDFGHFLGNFKKKFGFNRERAAFVFTPEMAYAMGGKNFKESANFKTFKDICCKAFNSLRKHASLLENLFILMVSAGMPELGNMEDIEYLKEKLLLSHSDSEAEKQFRKEIQKSLDNTWRRIDNAIHNVKHG